MQTTKLKIRPPKPSDLNFIFASFSNSMKRESELGRSCRSSVFFTQFQKIIDRLLENAAIIIACSSEEENFIVGYLIYDEPFTIHFTFVRPSCRMKNVARDLIDVAFDSDSRQLEFTLNTNDAKKISKKYPELIHNPFVLFKTK